MRFKLQFQLRLMWYVGKLRQVLLADSRSQGDPEADLEDVRAVQTDNE